MKYQVYVKKEIKAEADFPLEDIKWYYGHTTDTDELVRLRNSIHSDWNYIDWYLQPIELDIPDDADITDEFTKEHYTYDIGRHLRVNKDRIFGAKTIRDKIEKPLK